MSRSTDEAGVLLSYQERQMKRAELARKLKAMGVPEGDYSLSGGLPNEAYCWEQSGGKWRFYYSEREEKNALRVFDTEQEACDYFYATVRHDLGLA